MDIRHKFSSWICLTGICGKTMNVKKMLSKSNEAVINEILSWTPPVFHQKSECYVSFTAFCPTSGKMKLKKIMMGHIKGGKKQQRLYADHVIKRLTEKLMNGWNPWIETERPLEYERFSEVCEKYRKYIMKMIDDDNMREQTVVGYLSKLHILQEWNEEKKIGIHYVYQFDGFTVGRFIDYVFIERNNTLRTRNHYVAWLKTFSHWLLTRQYLNKDPMVGFVCTKKNIWKKDRDVIPDSELSRLYTYLKDKNKHYLLACYLLHYVFVRPREMSWMKIQDINIRNQTLYIHGEHAKNHNDAAVTLPKKVIELMIDLNIFSRPGQYYLFSDKFAPGKERKSEKCFRDFWIKYVRRDLGFSNRYKFYSLKDTGITNMLRANTDVLTVRDQARHSSILITDTYTPKDIKKANELLMKYDGNF